MFPTGNLFGVHLNPGQNLFSIQSIVDGVSWRERNVIKKPNKKTILHILKWLEFQNMICRESNGSGTFISVCNWERYQSDKKAKVTEGTPQGIPEGTPQGIPTKEVKEVKEEKNNPPHTYSEKFETFWKSYPKKQGKFKAFASWKKYNCDNGIFDSIMASLESHKKSEGWTKENGKYIPHGLTWVNGMGWEDSVEDQPKTESWDR